MTEKERKAIEELKSLSPSEGAIEIVLNLIKRQEKKISNLQEQIDLMATAISCYDGQLVINTYRNKDDVKKRFKDMVKGD